MDTQEKKEGSINLQERFEHAKTVESINDLEPLRKSEEPYTFVTVRSAGTTYVLMPNKEEPDEKIWLAYNGEDYDNLNIVAEWMCTATKMFKEKPRSREEMSYLRVMYLSFNNICSLLKLPEDQSMQMFSMMCYAIAEKWAAADSVTFEGPNVRIYVELVAKYLHALQDLVSRAAGVTPEQK